MNDVYLVGGLTPRTDLDNYQTAFLSKEKAEESKAYWNSFHEDNDYDEYHIDSIEIEDLAEHDKQIRAEVVDLIDRHLWNYSHEVWEDFKPILEQLKGVEE